MSPGSAHIADQARNINKDHTRENIVVWKKLEKVSWRRWD